MAKEIEYETTVYQLYVVNEAEGVRMPISTPWTAYPALRLCMNSVRKTIKPLLEDGTCKLVVQKTLKTEVTTNHLVHAGPDHFAVNDELYDL